ncbi:hypothetical protein GCM10010302_02530 [Streptomyces polychromogenes]|uniref:Secreted protein n=1 Tax=Streptomyces polychromogenes TaxID=67342 RepID=A0ABN0UZZ8_9ACTN
MSSLAGHRSALFVVLSAVALVSAWAGTSLPGSSAGWGVVAAGPVASSVSDESTPTVARPFSLLWP